VTLLVIGGTGTLGRQIVRKALENGFNVRCIVRNKKSASFLQEWGAELVYGNLTLPETLALCFQGVTAVIDASTTRPDDDSNLVDVDWYGKLMLIDLAKRVKIKRFIFFSIMNAEKYPYISLMNMKSGIEEALKNSGVPYTIFKCAGFFQALINQYAIPILEEKPIWTTKESVAISYIDTQNIATLCIKSLSLNTTQNKSFFLGGPKSWISKDIIDICEKLSGQKAKIQLVPLGFLKIVRQITGFLDWTQKISERLAFVEVLMDDSNFNSSLSIVYETFKIREDELLSLDSYLREYFEMMLVTLENLNVEKGFNKKDLII